MDWNAEVARFLTIRMRRDAETVQAAMGCGNGLKLAEIRQAWISQSVEDYVHETRRLMEMSSDIVACLFTAARRRPFVDGRRLHRLGFQPLRQPVFIG